MAALLTRLLAVAVLLVPVAWPCIGCGGGADASGPEATPAGTTEATDAATESAATEEEPTDTSTDESGAAEADAPDVDAKTPGEPTCMLDVFRRLAVGDWVQTRWTNKEIHTLLVAAKTDELITIEEIVTSPRFTTPIAWTQLDIALEDGSLRALRERLADGTIVEREPEPGAQRGTSDLLLEPFRADGSEEFTQDPIKVYVGEDVVDTKRGLFQCRRYKITIQEGRYAHVWFSRIKLPEYPVKIHYYEENLTIKLEAFGSERASGFTTKPQRHRRRESNAE